MNKKTLTNIVLLSQIAFPLLALADDLGTTINNFTTWGYLLINFLLVLATLVFLWGIIKYITAGGDSGKISEARSYILWGLVGLAVMGSVWALTHYILNVFNVNTSNNAIPKYNQTP